MNDETQNEPHLATNGCDPEPSTDSGNIDNVVSGTNSTVCGGAELADQITDEVAASKSSTASTVKEPKHPEINLTSDSGPAPDIHHIADTNETKNAKTNKKLIALGQRHRAKIYMLFNKQQKRMLFDLMKDDVPHAQAVETIVETSGKLGIRNQSLEDWLSEMGLKVTPYGIEGTSNRIGDGVEAAAEVVASADDYGMSSPPDTLQSTQPKPLEQKGSSRTFDGERKELRLAPDHVADEDSRSPDQPLEVGGGNMPSAANETDSSEPDSKDTKLTAPEAGPPLIPTDPVRDSESETSTEVGITSRNPDADLIATNEKSTCRSPQNDFEPSNDPDVDPSTAEVELSEMYGYELAHSETLECSDAGNALRLQPVNAMENTIEEDETQPTLDSTPEAIDEISLDNASDDLCYLEVNVEPNIEDESADGSKNPAVPRIDSRYQKFLEGLKSKFGKRKMRKIRKGCDTNTSATPAGESMPGSEAKAPKARRRTFVGLKKCKLARWELKLYAQLCGIGWTPEQALGKIVRAWEGSGPPGSQAELQGGSNAPKKESDLQEETDGSQPAGTQFDHLGEKHLAQLYILFNAEQRRMLLKNMANMPHAKAVEQVLDASGKRGIKNPHVDGWLSKVGLKVNSKGLLGTLDVSTLDDYEVYPVTDQWEAEICKLFNTRQKLMLMDCTKRGARRLKPRVKAVLIVSENIGIQNEPLDDWLRMNPEPQVFGKKRNRKIVALFNERQNEILVDLLKKGMSKADAVIRTVQISGERGVKNEPLVQWFKSNCLPFPSSDGATLDSQPVGQPVRDSSSGEATGENVKYLGEFGDFVLDLVRHPKCTISLDEIVQMARRIPEERGSYARRLFVLRCYKFGEDPESWDWSQYSPSPSGPKQIRFEPCQPRPECSRPQQDRPPRCGHASCEYYSVGLPKRRQEQVSQGHVGNRSVRRHDEPSVAPSASTSSNNENSQATFLADQRRSEGRAQWTSVSKDTQVRQDSISPSLGMHPLHKAHSESPEDVGRFVEELKAGSYSAGLQSSSAAPEPNRASVNTRRWHEPAHPIGASSLNDPGPSRSPERLYAPPPIKRRLEVDPVPVGTQPKKTRIADPTSSGDTIRVYVVPNGYPSVGFDVQEMCELENGILEAMLEINEEWMRPQFNGSFRNKGRYEVICRDLFSKNWLERYVGALRLKEPFKIIPAETVKEEIGSLPPVNMRIASNSEDSYEMSRISADGSCSFVKKEYGEDSRHLSSCHPYYNTNCLKSNLRGRLGPKVESPLYGQSGFVGPAACDSNICEEPSAGYGRIIDRECSDASSRFNFHGRNLRERLAPALTGTPSPEDSPPRYLRDEPRREFTSSTPFNRIARSPSPEEDPPRYLHDEPRREFTSSTPFNRIARSPSPEPYSSTFQSLQNESTYGYHGYQQSRSPSPRYDRSRHERDGAVRHVSMICHDQYQVTRNIITYREADETSRYHLPRSPSPPSDYYSFPALPNSPSPEYSQGQRFEPPHGTGPSSSRRSHTHAYEALTYDSSSFDEYSGYGQDGSEYSPAGSHVGSPSPGCYGHSTGSQLESRRRRRSPDTSRSDVREQLTEIRSRRTAGSGKVDLLPPASYLSYERRRSRSPPRQLPRHHPKHW